MSARFEEVFVLITRISSRLKHLNLAWSNLGFVNMLGYVWQKGLGLANMGSTTHFLRSPNALHPIRLRRGSSDIHVFHQIFIEQEYQVLSNLSGVDLVIDCGANIGCSAAYFLTRFPACHVIAVEPDPANFQLLTENMKPYGNRVRCIQSGIWSHSTGLVMSEQPYRDQGHWARQVRECHAGETPMMTAVDIAGLLAGSGFSRISILKMDVEGAEAVIFGHNYQQWINLVDAIVIELHHDTHMGDCEKVFLKAIEGRDFAISRSGELTVCLPKPANIPETRRSA